MDQNQLERFKRWFDEYTGRFQADDAFTNAHLRLKKEHTYRTCDEAVLLAEALALDEDQRRMAELIGLFHDVGRFPQFAQYGTFCDAKSVNHGRLGVEVLRQEGILDIFPAQQRQWMTTAIEHHGAKVLPPGLSGQTLLFCRLIRDADKIDILRVCVACYAQEPGPEAFIPGIELADTTDCSPHVVEAVLQERVIDYTELRTRADMKLCQLGWVYDLNFAASLRRIDQCGFLEQLCSFLPENEATRRVCTKIRDYVGSKLT
jgi:hypothetical protein